MKTKRRKSHRVVSSYDTDFKKAVILFAEEKGNSEATKFYGVSESNVRRWRRLKNEILRKHESSLGNKGRTRMPGKRKYTRRGTQPEKDPLDFTGTGDQDSDPIGKAYAMPLTQRLFQPPPETPKMPVLQSQPLSPTKLKVTRQSLRLTTSQITPEPEPEPEPVKDSPNQEVCLRWNSHHSNMQTSLPSLLLKERYVDVTIVVEGKRIKCHRIILSSCSPYFEEILQDITPHQHPVLFLKDVPFWIMNCLCDFMYAGEVNILQNKLEELLSVAEALQIKGLAGKTSSEKPKETKEPVENKDIKPVEPSTSKTENSMENQIKKVENQSKKVENQTRKVETQSRKVESQPKKVETQSRRTVNQSARTETPKSIEYQTRRSTSRYRNEFKSSSINETDPLDLLQPLYEEVEKKPSATMLRRESKLSTRRTVPRRVRKRKMSERESSPVPVFNFRKGTRSRPNVKIPKFYESTFNKSKKSTPSTQMQESQEIQPSTSNAPPQTDPLSVMPMIKHEPIDDIDENVIIFNEEDSVTHGDSSVFDHYDNSLSNPLEEDQEVEVVEHPLSEQSLLMDTNSAADDSQNYDASTAIMDSNSPAEDSQNFDTGGTIGDGGVGLNASGSDGNRDESGCILGGGDSSVASFGNIGGINQPIITEVRSVTPDAEDKLVNEMQEPSTVSDKMDVESSVNEESTAVNDPLNISHDSMPDLQLESNLVSLATVEFPAHTLTIEPIRDMPLLDPIKIVQSISEKMLIDSQDENPITALHTDDRATTVGTPKMETIDENLRAIENNENLEDSEEINDFAAVIEENATELELEPIENLIITNNEEMLVNNSSEKTGEGNVVNVSVIDEEVESASGELNSQSLLEEIPEINNILDENMEVEDGNMNEAERNVIEEIEKTIVLLNDLEGKTDLLDKVEEPQGVAFTNEVPSSNDLLDEALQTTVAPGGDDGGDGETEQHEMCLDDSLTNI